MGTSGEGTLTQLARALQADNQKFQQEVTGACMQASQNPGAALLRLNQCWAEVDDLERRELDFLSKMGPFGVQQAEAAKASWGQNRLQVLAGKAQVLFALGRYDDAQTTIETARGYVSGPMDAAAGLLDQLEIGIIQMRG